MSRGYTPREGTETLGTIAKDVAKICGLSERAATAVLAAGFDQVARAVYEGKRVVVSGLGVFTRRNGHAVNNAAIQCGLTSRAYFRPAKWLRGLPPVDIPEEEE